MKKLIKKTIIFGALLLTLYLIGHPLQSHLAYKVYPKLPINLCFFTYGTTIDPGHFYSNKKECFIKRALENDEWQSCLYSYSPSNCIARISSVTNKYLCDNLNNSRDIENCQRDLISYTQNNIEEISGTEKYKVIKSITVKNGEKFLLSKITIKGNEVEFFSHSRMSCSGVQNPPLKVNTIDGGPNFIYITDCQINQDQVVFHFFRYNFPWLNFLDEVK